MNVMGIGIIEIIEPLIHQQHALPGILGQHVAEALCEGSSEVGETLEQEKNLRQYKLVIYMFAYVAKYCQFLERRHIATHPAYIYIYVIYLVISWSQLIWVLFSSLSISMLGFSLGNKHRLFRKCLASSIRASGNGESHESRDAG